VRKFRRLDLRIVCRLVRREWADDTTLRGADRVGVKIARPKASNGLAPHRLKVFLTQE